VGNIRKLNAEIGLTVLFVEQNIDMILSVAQRCWVMGKGAIADQVRPAIWPTRSDEN
jgi:urea transport system ATP-binding protein